MIGSSRIRRSRWLTSVAFAAWLSLPSPALAQSDTAQATAVALFDEARELMKKGQHAEACPKLEESQRLSPGIGTLYNLADCYEKTGRTASAWLKFREVVAQSMGAGQTDRADVARRRVEAIEPRLCRVRIEIAEPAPDMSVELDGAPASSATWGTAVPVDPGEHVVRASAPGYQPWEGSLPVKREGETVTFAVPRLRPEGATPPPTPPVAGVPAAPPPSDAPPDPGPEPSSGTPWQVPVGIAATSVGVVGLGVGTALGFSAKSSADDADCDDQNVCSQAGVDDRDSAVATGNVATIVFIAGGVFTVGGLVLWLTAPSPEATSDAASSGPSLGLAPQPGGASLVGRF